VRIVPPDTIVTYETVEDHPSLEKLQDISARDCSPS
jgi:hypothetical protein